MYVFYGTIGQMRGVASMNIASNTGILCQPIPPMPLPPGHPWVLPISQTLGMDLEARGGDTLEIPS